jgi:hypothetical protein
MLAKRDFICYDTMHINGEWEMGDFYDYETGTRDVDERSGLGRDGKACRDCADAAVWSDGGRIWDKAE